MPIRAAINAFFLLSGATALIYQVLWIRMVGLVIGHSALAVAAVVGSTMAGLGIGAAAAGRRVNAVEKPLFAYGVLELGISACALASPLLLGRSVLGALPRLGLPLHGLVAAAALLLLPATLAMGATLPLLTRWYARRREHLGRDMGWLYAINTTGAVVGAGLSGFVLLPGLGQPTTLLLAAGLSASVGLGAVLLGLRYPLLPEDAGSDPSSNPGSEDGGAGSGDAASVDSVRVAATAGGDDRRILFAFLLSGAAALTMQVAWTRCFELFVGSTTYAFSGIVCAFIAGLALGGHALARVVDRTDDRVSLLAALNLGIAVFAGLLVPVLGELPMWLIGPLAERAGSFAATQRFLLVLLFGLLFVPTFLMGGTYPVATRALTRRPEDAGVVVGKAYAWNTCGAVLGAVGAGLVLIPCFGLRGSLCFAIGLNLFAAALLLAPKRRLAWGLPLLAVALGLVGPSWNPRHMNLAPHMYARDLAANPGLLQSLAETGSVVFHEEGRGATVSVIQRPEGARVLRINGKTDASTEADRLGQGMLGHLPMLLARAPDEVLLIGLGSGMSLASVLAHPAERVQVVELLPEVARAAEHFGPLLGDPLTDPRVELQVADGRQVLLSDQGPWDVVISQPTNLFISGIATLFTVEAFEAMRNGLKEGGVAAVWLQGYLLPEEDFATLCRTFLAVFPEAELWNAGPFDYFLLGGRGALPLERAALDRRIDATARSLAGHWTGVRSAADLQRHYVLSQVGLRELSGVGPVQRDRDPFLEFSTPRGLYGGVPLLDVPALLARRTVLPLSPPEAEQLAGAERRVERLGHLERAVIRGDLEAIEKVRVLDPNHPVLRDRRARLLHKRALAALQNGELTAAEYWSDEVRRLAPESLPAFRLKSLLRRQAGDLEGAVAVLERAVENQSWNVYAHLELALIYEELGRLSKADRTWESVLALDPSLAADRPVRPSDLASP